VPVVWSPQATDDVSPGHRELTAIRPYVIVYRILAAETVDI
jgi:hypothetical protein